MNHFFEVIRNLPNRAAMALIIFYKKCISPLTPSSCRFYPTCSEYGLEAFRRFGFINGFRLTFKRIMKCHPRGPYGYDPVPDSLDEIKKSR